MRLKILEYPDSKTFYWDYLQLQILKDRLNPPKHQINKNFFKDELPVFERRLSSSNFFKSSPKLIPKKIHFIWLGGSLPAQYLDNIKKLAQVAKRSGFKITLWTDNPTKQKKNMELHYLTDSRTVDAAETLAVANLKIRHIKALISNMEKDPWYRSNNLEKKFSYCVNRELIGLRNYAAASDYSGSTNLDHS